MQVILVIHQVANISKLILLLLYAYWSFVYQILILASNTDINL